MLVVRQGFFKVIFRFKRLSEGFRECVEGFYVYSYGLLYGKDIDLRLVKGRDVWDGVLGGLDIKYSWFFFYRVRIVLFFSISE